MAQRIGSNCLLMPVEQLQHRSQIGQRLGWCSWRFGCRAEILQRQLQKRLLLLPRQFRSHDPQQAPSLCWCACNDIQLMQTPIGITAQKIELGCQIRRDWKLHRVHMRTIETYKRLVVFALIGIDTAAIHGCFRRRARQRQQHVKLCRCLLGHALKLIHASSVQPGRQAIWVKRKRTVEIEFGRIKSTHQCQRQSANGVAPGSVRTQRDAGSEHFDGLWASAQSQVASAKLEMRPVKRRIRHDCRLICLDRV